MITISINVDNIIDLHKHLNNGEKIQIIYNDQPKDFLVTSYDLIGGFSVETAYHSFTLKGLEDDQDALTELCIVVRAK